MASHATDYRIDGIGTDVSTQATPLFFRRPKHASVEVEAVTVLESVDALSAHQADLEDLASDLAAPNVAYEPWVLLPILRVCERHAVFRFVMVFEPWAEGRRRLIGFFPFERVRVHRFVPLMLLRLWADPFNYLNARCDPLVRRGKEHCVGEMLNWFMQGKANVSMLNLRGLTGNTTLHDIVSERMQAFPASSCLHSVTTSHIYRRSADADGYFKRTFSSKSQQTLRRYERRLGELGTVTYRDVDDGTNIDALADEFIDLENRGWKGQRGVAVESYGHRNLIKGLLREAHRRGRLSLLTLRIDGKLVAARCVILSRPGSHLFKLTYDESDLYAKRSPGLLLELEAIRRLHSDSELLGKGIDWMDTCASPYSSIFSRSRSDPLPIHRYIVARPRSMAHAILAAAPKVTEISNRVGTTLQSFKERIDRARGKDLAASSPQETSDGA